MATETTPQNAWVESYLNALLTYGLSSEYTGETKTAQSKKAPESDRFYVQSLLNLNEEALSAAWLKAASVTKQGNDKDARLQYLSWRIWFLKRQHAHVQRGRPHEGGDEDRVPRTPEDLSEDDTTAEPRAGRPTRRVGSSVALAGTVPSPSPEPRPRLVQPAARDGGEAGAAAKAKEKLKVNVGQQPSVTFDTAFEEFQAASPLQGTTPSFAKEAPQFDKLYIILISLHGLVRGDRMELGRDSDTGGQVKYVVELTKAMARHPAVHRVELLTRQIKDPSVDASYGVEEECLAKGLGDTGGAYIVRLPCGPVQEYVRKELLWPHVREFADRGIAHATAQLARIAETGRRCELYAVHGHYADAGEVAVLMSGTLDAHMIMTGHSLGRNKLEHLLAGGIMTRREIEENYAIGRRIEAEERALDTALMVFTSTQQEIDEQWGLYDGYSPGLARVLHFRRSYGRHMPLLKVSPPGLDFSNLKVTIPADPVVKEFEEQRAAFAELELAPQASQLSSQASDVGAEGKTPSHSGPTTPRVPETLDPSVALIPEGPPIWQDIARFLRNPLKPAILAMSRPDPKKNLTTLVKAYGESPMLRELSNLVLIMGNRDDIDSMSSGSQKVLVQVLKLIDKYDLHGSVAFPKHHTQADISDIYKFATATRGVFTNIALQEPFGLTVIEAAAHGAPTVATSNGGPVDIMATLHHGVTVDPTNTGAVIAALLKILTNPQMWDEMSRSGVDNIMAYSWPSHVKRYVEALDAEVRFIKSYKRHDRTMSGLVDSRTALKGALEKNEAHAKTLEKMAMDRHFSLPQPMRVNVTLHGGAGGQGLQAIRRNISGISADDMALLQTMSPDAFKSSKAPAASQRDHLVFFTLDSETVVPDVAVAILSLLGKIRSTGALIGIGVLSMLGFDRSKKLLGENKVELNDIDFMVCNSGADAWHRAENGEWDADEMYQALIEFEWDRTSMYRTLTKIVSRPAGGDQAKVLPRLKELLYNVVEAPEVGVHPRHFCIELDPETQAILSIGMGPKAKETKGVKLASTVADRLKRRLRSKGFRATYTLQMVPRDGSFLAALHITPVRASRSMALRFLARLWGNDLESVSLVALVPATQGDDPTCMSVSSYTNDLADLLAGMQKVVVVPVESTVTPGSEKISLLDQFGVALKPWASYGDRLCVEGPDTFADAILDRLAKK